jgi:hypothetical protein
MFFSAFISHLETELFYRWQAGEKGADRTFGRFFWNLHYLRKFGLLTLPNTEQTPAPEATQLTPTILQLVTSDDAPQTSLTDLLRDMDNRLYAARKLRNTLHETLKALNAEIEQLNAQKRQKNKCARYATMRITSPKKNGTPVPHTSVRRKAANE